MFSSLYYTQRGKSRCSYSLFWLSVSLSLTSEDGGKLRRKRFKSDAGALIKRPVRRGGQFAGGKSDTGAIPPAFRSFAHANDACSASAGAQCKRVKRRQSGGLLRIIVERCAWYDMPLLLAASPLRRVRCVKPITRKIICVLSGQAEQSCEVGMSLYRDIAEPDRFFGT